MKSKQRIATKQSLRAEKKVGPVKEPSAELGIDPEQCYRALLSRDARFDGQFFTGVHTTGIYCRSVCPAVKPKRQNVSFYPSAAAAAAQGFRPCLRCRPAQAPPKAIAEPVLAQAVAMIDDGFLQQSKLPDLAAVLGYSERQLRNLFRQYLACSPLQYALHQRLQLALRLLQSSDLSITDIAGLSGFGSLRRCNDAFQKHFAMPPSAFRGKASVRASAWLSLTLSVDKDYDWASMLAFHSDRSLAGVELVEQGCWWRWASLENADGLRCEGWLCMGVGRRRGELALRVDRALLAVLPQLLQRLRRVFDLDCRIAPVRECLAADAQLAEVIERYPGIALPGSWDVWECCVRAVVGQLISLKAALTIVHRLIAQLGKPPTEATEGAADGATKGAVEECGSSLRKERGGAFPSTAAFAGADVQLLRDCGLSQQKARCLQALATAVEAGELVLDGSLAEAMSLEQRVASLREYPGIGEWSAQYIAMRGFAHPNAFPAGDLVLQKAAAEPGGRLKERELLQRAEAWQPWRAYAAIYLWRRYTLLEQHGGGL